MAPRPGACTACLHGRPLADALDGLHAHGLTSVEVDAGGSTPSPHCHVDLPLSSERARRDHLDQFDARGMELTGLNCTGNPLSPLPQAGPEHADDLRRTVELAGPLGVRYVVTTSGNGVTVRGRRSRPRRRLVNGVLRALAVVDPDMAVDIEHEAPPRPARRARPGRGDLRAAAVTA
jgi:sugar phosphate isomerase/epimerase